MLNNIINSAANALEEVSVSLDNLLTIEEKALMNGLIKEEITINGLEVTTYKSKAIIDNKLVKGIPAKHDKKTNVIISGYYTVSEVKDDK